MLLWPARAAIAAGLPLLVVTGHEAVTIRTALKSSPERGGRPTGQRAVEGCPPPGEDPLHQPAAGPPPRAGKDQEQVTFTHAPLWRTGMAASLAAGIAAAPAHWTGAIILLADMPGVAPELLTRLAAAITTPESVAVPTHAGQRGNPVGWGRAWFAKLAALTGDTGGRALLAVACATEIEATAAIHADIDTPAALAGWHARDT